VIAMRLPQCTNELSLRVRTIWKRLLASNGLVFQSRAEIDVTIAHEWRRVQSQPYKSGTWQESASCARSHAACTIPRLAHVCFSIRVTYGKMPSSNIANRGE